MTAVEAKAWQYGWSAFHEKEPRAVTLSTLKEETAWYRGYDAAVEYENKRIASQEFSNLSTWIEE